MRRAALAVNAGIAEDGGSSVEVFLVDLDDEVESDSNANATLSREFAE